MSTAVECSVACLLTRLDMMCLYSLLLKVITYFSIGYFSCIEINIIGVACIVLYCIVLLLPSILKIFEYVLLEQITNYIFRY